MGKNIYKSFLLLLALLCMVVSTDAQTVSVADAMLKAQSLRGSSAKSSGSKSNNAIQLAYTSEDNNQPLYYVFNYPEGGFAIIGGDEKAREILGYCTNGAFNIDSIPDGMRFMLKSYGEQIASAIANGSTTAIKIEETTLTDIPQLITTQWDQDEPYNCMIPLLKDDMPRFVTGCAATAAAQIMKFWNYPIHGIGSNSRSINYSSYGIKITFSADFANTTYDWDNMLDNYSDGYNETQAEAVGIIMYHAGVALNMSYGWSGSSASDSKVLPAFKNYFGYSTDSKWVARDTCTNEEWENLVYSELKEARPLFYIGQSTNGGHAFICDGYEASSGNYHFNWGWGGYCDGYYPLTGTGALQPNGSGIGGAGGDASYTGSQAIVVGLQPASDPILVTDITLDCSSATLAVGDTKTLSVTVLPNDATRKNVTWSSSNPDIATVDAGGIVTAISAGEAIITATSIDGTEINATCTITVTEGPSRADVVVYNPAENAVFFSTDNDSEWIWNDTENCLQSNPESSMSQTTMTITLKYPCKMSVTLQANNNLKIYINGKESKTEIEGNSIITWTFFSAGTYKFTFQTTSNDIASISDIQIFGMPGDANCDGNTDVLDIATTVKYIQDSDSVDKMDTKAVDINGDRSVTADDLTSLVNLILEKNNSDSSE